MRIKFLISALVLLTAQLFAQDDNVSFTYGDYFFKTTYDTAGYCSVLQIYKGDKVLLTSECTDKFEAITAEDLDNDGKKEILIEQYTGGAHCCMYLTAARMINDKLVMLDTIFWGDSGYQLKDLNNDGKKELQGVNAWFAYAFTSFAGSRFNVLIFRFKNNKFYDATKEFPDLVEADIKELKSELKEYLKTGFDCPKEDEDKYSSTAGEVKAILAPIVANYYNLDDVEAGYDYVRQVYKCPKDVNTFIKVLQNDYKLK